MKLKVALIDVMFEEKTKDFAALCTILFQFGAIVLQSVFVRN